MITKMIIKKQDGATTVEFAIIVPLLLLLTFGIIEFGLLLFNKHLIVSACREGARAGIVAREHRFADPTPTKEDAVNVIETVEDYLANSLVTFGGTDLPKIDVEVTDSSGNFGYYSSTDDTVTQMLESDRETGYRAPLRVTVSYDYHFLFLSNIGLGPIDLVSQANMLME